MKRKNYIKKIALKTIQIEEKTISGLKNSINDDFFETVKVIFKSKGRVVITGIGKSALIAKKIVATLNSTGTPSIFMHAADAIHGDLGMITGDDVILCISKSGETPELKILIPFLKNTGNILIGMVGKKNSFLGKQANFVLLTPVPKEADPNNLAPTASTTAQMVMGDAIAVALLALKGFTSKDFAQFHPGGALGKQLYLKVGDIYPLNEKPEVSENENIRNTIMEMTSKRLGATAVLDKKGNLKGIITDGDLRRMLESNKDISKLKANDIMSVSPKTINEDALAVKALEIMRKNNITQLIVADTHKYLGIIHLHDLIREGLL